ncbi:MAG: insulinase family protein, partial [Planctomycetes bacterium]|nr:insulinase family protein [Planctomycetota bacterium]
MLQVVVSLGLSVCASFSVGEHTFHYRTLPNGLHALAADDGDRERASVFVVYGVGNRMETSRTTGMAHLTEHALFTGTATTPAGQHDAKVKALGGESNAYTRDDFTTYYAHNFEPSALTQILALEADRMRGLTWEEGAFLHERERLRVEEQHSHNGEVDLSGRRDLTVWDGRDYGAGIPDERGNTWGPQLTLAQVRAFYDAWYHPRNAAVVVLGADPEQALDAIEAAFGALPAGPKPGKRMNPPRIAGRAETLELPLSRDRLEWIFMGPSLDVPEDRVALLLIAELLEGRKTPDGAPVSVWQGGRTGDDLFVLAATGDGAQATLEALYAELQAQPWDEAALAKAKLNLRDGFSSSPLRSRPYFSLAVDVAALAAVGHVDWPERFAERIDAVTPADLARAAERWLKPEQRMTLAIKATGEVLPLPSDREGLKQAAEAAATSGDLDRAIAAYEKLLELQPGRIDLVIYRYTLGALNRDLGKLEEARRHLVEGLKVVEYPALRELLTKVDAELKAAGKDPGAPTSQPTTPPDPHGGGANPHGGGANPHGGGENPHGGGANPHGGGENPHGGGANPH